MRLLIARVERLRWQRELAALRRELKQGRYTGNRPTLFDDFEDLNDEE